MNLNVSILVIRHEMLLLQSKRRRLSHSIEDQDLSSQNDYRDTKMIVSVLSLGTASMSQRIKIAPHLFSNIGTCAATFSNILRQHVQFRRRSAASVEQPSPGSFRCLLFNDLTAEYILYHNCLFWCAPLFG